MMLLGKSKALSWIKEQETFGVVGAANYVELASNFLLEDPLKELACSGSFICLMGYLNLFSRFGWEIMVQMVDDESFGFSRA